MPVTWELRAAFARRLAAMYGREVPAYTTLVEVSREVNAEVVRPRRRRRRAAGLHRAGHRRAARRDPGRHARASCAQVGARLRRDGHAPGRLLRPARRRRRRGPGRLDGVPPDRRPRSWPATRSGCSPRCSSPTTRGSSTPNLRAALGELPRRAGSCSRPSCSRSPTGPSAEGGLPTDAADEFLRLATAAFALSPEPVDRAWYDELDAGLRGRRRHRRACRTHAHQPPHAARARHRRAVRARMQARGIEMIDEIQGPPRWDGPDVLLRQTSFRALAEPRTFRYRRRDGRAPGRCGCGSARSRRAASR